MFLKKEKKYISKSFFCTCFITCQVLQILTNKLSVIVSFVPIVKVFKKNSFLILPFVSYFARYRLSRDFKSSASSPKNQLVKSPVLFRQSQGKLNSFQSQESAGQESSLISTKLNCFQSQASAGQESSGISIVYWSDIHSFLNSLVNLLVRNTVKAGCKK